MIPFQGTSIRALLSSLPPLLTLWQSVWNLLGHQNFKLLACQQPVSKTNRVKSLEATQAGLQAPIVSWNFQGVQGIAALQAKMSNEKESGTWNLGYTSMLGVGAVPACWELESSSSTVKNFVWK